jgi:vitamin B12 transporter
MNKVLSLALACFLVAANQSWSATLQTLEPIIVTATKLDTPAREVASSVSVVGRQDLENKQAHTVLDALRDIPALDVVRSGGIGQQTSVFLRGANSAHTLVLIDGIEVNDPSTSTRFFDFSFLSTDNIERIEILRGPGSTLYGSDALGGVINIITKRGKGKPTASFSLEGGSYETHQEKFDFSGGTEFINYSLSASFLESDGISSASTKDGNHERDGYDRTAVASRIGLTPAEFLDIDFIFRYTDSESELDDFVGPGADDPNNTLDTESIFFRSQAAITLFENLWEQKIGFSLTDYDRKNIDNPDPVDPLDATNSQFKSRLHKVDWQHNFNLHPTNILTFGLEYEKEKAEFTTAFSSLDEKSAETTGYYLQDQIKLWNSFFTTLGLRVDDHNRFGSRLTYRITSAYVLDQSGTKIKASYGTAFKAPSLSQLFEESAFAVANPDLDPEKSRGWDVGIEQSFLEEKLILSATYFENHFEDLIVGVPVDPNDIFGPFQNVNLDEAQTKGVELTATVRPFEGLILKGNYTYTDTEDRETGEQLLRRPRHKYNLGMNYRFLAKGNIHLDVLYVGERDDVGGIKLDAYTTINLAAYYDLTKYLRVFGRVDNLFDEEYEEVSGFGTPGIAGTIGGRITF